jgi:hypothetical protein
MDLTSLCIIVTMQKISFILYFSIAISGCKSGIDRNATEQFNRLSVFEVSYNGGIEKLHLRIDSNGIFHAAPAGVYDTILYGNMPDELLASVDSIITIIKTNKLGNSPVTSYHAQRLSIFAVIENDTIRLIQGSGIHPGLIDHTLKLKEYVATNFHSYFTLTNTFQTAIDVYDLPPSIK